MPHITLGLKFTTLVLAISLFFATGCKKDSAGGSQSSSGNGSSASASGGSADDPNSINGHGDKDAVEAARAELAKHWVRAGDGWYSEFPSQVSLATGQRAGPESFYREFKELKFDVEPSDLSDSDKLNGVQFRGTCNFNSAPVRVYGDPNAFGPPVWADWHPSIEFLRVVKKNGKWDVDGGYLISGTIPSPAVLAKLK